MIEIKSELSIDFYFLLFSKLSINESDKLSIFISYPKRKKKVYAPG